MTDSDERGGQSPVVVDTMLASAIIVGAKRDPQRDLLDRYEQHLLGRPLVLSFVSVAELRYGSRRAGWGAARLHQLESWLRQVAVPMPTMTSSPSVLTCARTASPQVTRFIRTP